MSTRVTTRTPVDEYLTALSKSLAGPRRRKADLLAEARDHLTDATEAFEADGLDRVSAEREAVTDFGTPEDVVPGYRADLAVSQSRRTAVLLFGALIIQPIVWQQGFWSWNREPIEANALNDVLQTLVRSVGMVVIAGAVLAVIAAGVGLRHSLVRAHLSRVTALFALASSVVISTISVWMASTSPHPSLPLDFGVVASFVVLPLLLVGQQAGRCLRLTRS